MSELKIKKVKRGSDSFNNVKALLYEAFPRHEVSPMWVLALLGKRSFVDFNAYYDEDAFCGFTLTARDKDILLVLYLAVDGKFRSKGYGSQILTLLKETFPDKTIVLESEAPSENAENYAQRHKRLEFYFRNGFFASGKLLIDRKESYVVLSTSREFPLKAYRALHKKLRFGIIAPNVGDAL